MRKRWDVVVIGGANTDYLVQGDRLPAPGQTLQGRVFHEGPGGKGANQAVAAARLGARTALVARLGDDPRGRRLLDALHEERVRTRWIALDPQFPSGVALILLDGRGHKEILTAPGANMAMTVADVHRAEAALRSARVVVAQLEVPLPVVEEAFAIAALGGARTILDPAPAVPLPDQLLARADVVRPNASEAQVLTGVEVTDRATARVAAQQLLARGTRMAVVQAGDEGDLMVWGDDEVFLPRVAVETVDTTGAGDAFVAALAVAMAEGMPLQDAGRFANAAAALASTVLGAQPGLPRRAQLEAML